MDILHVDFLEHGVVQGGKPQKGRVSHLRKEPLLELRVKARGHLHESSKHLSRHDEQTNNRGGMAHAACLDMTPQHTQRDAPSTTPW